MTLGVRKTDPFPGSSKHKKILLKLKGTFFLRARNIELNVANKPEMYHSIDNVRTYR